MPPTAPGTDYRSGFSVIIKHNGVAAIFIGGPTLQHWDLAADTPFPLNELDPDELPYVKAQAAGVVIKSLWQGAVMPFGLVDGALPDATASSREGCIKQSSMSRTTGAVGDGVADDSAAFVAARNAILATRNGSGVAV